MKQYDYKLISILILVILILGGIVYHVIRTDNITNEVIDTQMDKINDISPLIKDGLDNVIITLQKIDEAEHNIKILKDEMNQLKMDSINVDDAIILIKDKKNEIFTDSIMVNTPGFRF